MRTYRFLSNTGGARRNRKYRKNKEAKGICQRCSNLLDDKKYKNCSNCRTSARIRFYNYSH